MAYWLTEDAFIPTLTGIFLTIVLLLMAYSARNKVVMYIALVIAVLTAGIVTTESLIVTDREKVTDLVYELAQYARTNDVDAIATHISPAAPEVTRRMRSHMSQYEVKSCSIIGFNDFSSVDSSAEIDFVAWGQGRQRRAGGFEGVADPRVRLYLKKQPDESWKITEYDVSFSRGNVSL